LPAIKAADPSPPTQPSSPPLSQVSRSSPLTVGVTIFLPPSNVLSLFRANKLFMFLSALATPFLLSLFGHVALRAVFPACRSSALLPPSAAPSSTPQITSLHLARRDIPRLCFSHFFDDHPPQPAETCTPEVRYS